MCPGLRKLRPSVRTRVQTGSIIAAQDVVILRLSGPQEIASALYSEDAVAAAYVGQGGISRECAHKEGMRSTLGRWLVCGAIGVAALAAAQHFQLGVEFYRAGDYAAARVEFEAAFGLSQLPDCSITSA